MEGKPAIYLDRIIEKKNFRAFIYGTNGQKKLVESWDEYEANMESGVWFSTLEDALASNVNETEVKPKSKPKPKPRSKSIVKSESLKVDEDSDDVLPDDGSVIEVKDDFLP